MLGRAFRQTPEQGARTSLYLATSPEVSHITGKYFTKTYVMRPNPVLLGDDDARRLWSVSEELTSLSTRRADRHPAPKPAPQQ